ncbi:MAG: ATP-binding protein [Chloroflexi bacterium]|nr:ATP-binding protein [Chloroflexota bacterium]
MEFARFGLTPEIEIDDIVASLDSAQDQHVSVLKTVLEPYLEAHNARLDAVQDIQRVMDTFVSLLDNFYYRKQASLHLEQGLNIASDAGRKLVPTSLSSGEKQLLLIFCTAISARQDRTILMIDEPEISLNVEWQRQLIPALLKCLAGTSFQIIIATHSAEMLARYRANVTPLDDLRDEDHE